MTLIQYANMRWKQAYDSAEGQVTYKEIKECYPVYKYTQEWIDYLRSLARNKELKLADMKDLKKRGYDRIWFAILHDFPYLQKELT